ncbi:hypothetical protein HanIR_Chr03g0143881 [Helianthus annuus]|nr:hypothetical protein HanIR_Chr03g0143881 [Helianthus annuus]
MQRKERNLIMMPDRTPNEPTNNLHYLLRYLERSSSSWSDKQRKRVLEQDIVLIEKCRSNHTLL